MPFAARFNEGRRVTGDSSARRTPRERESQEAKSSDHRKTGIALGADVGNIALGARRTDHRDARRFAGRGIARAANCVPDACLRVRRAGSDEDRDAKAQFEKGAESFHTSTYSNIRSITLYEAYGAKCWIFQPSSARVRVGSRANDRFWREADPPTAVALTPFVVILSIRTVARRTPCVQTSRNETPHEFIEQFSHS